MDSDLLRLILLALGVILVVGIYLWDRYKRIARRMPMAPRHPRHAEPTLDGTDPNADPEPPEQSDDVLPPGEFVGEPVVKHRWDAEDPGRDSQMTMDLEFSAQGESDYLHQDPTLADELPRLIVQVVVLARNGSIDGKRIRDALASVEMQFGAMNIYHRENQQGQVLFSLASVVEPGSFPADQAEAFETPGLILFTQLPGAQDGLSIYSDMLFTAERLAVLLDADLHDETRSALTRQVIEHTRERILEHRNKVQMLRRRR